MTYATDPATLRLAILVSALGVLAAVALEATGWGARPLLVLAVMVVGVASSSVRTSRLPTARPALT